MSGNSGRRHCGEPPGDGELTQIQGFSGALFDSNSSDLVVSLTAISVPMSDTAYLRDLPPVPILPMLPELPVRR